MGHRTIGWMLPALVGLALAGCGGEAGHDDGHGAAAPGGLSAAQLEHGVGPVTELELGALDAALAARGAELFTLKCSACHKPTERYVGPALADVLERRSPAYVMNMMLDPAAMLEKHPEAKKLLAEFMTPMPNQSLTQDDARAVLEYLRTLAPEPTQAMENGHE